MPVTKEAGAKVIGGSINKTGSFIMRAEKVGADTLLARIVQMVAEAQSSRAPIQRLADQVSAWFVPAVIGAAAARRHRVGDVRPRAAIGLCAGRGGLGADHRLPLRAGAGHARCRSWSASAAAPRRACWSRTPRRWSASRRSTPWSSTRPARLTEGRPAVTAIKPAPGIDEAELLRLAASLERGSEHPLADAILRAANERGLGLSEATDFGSPVGRGRARRG